MIITRSPLRITLGGGGTDIPMFYEQHGANFVSAAINKHVYVSINNVNEKKYILRYSKYENVISINDIQHPIIREVLNHFNVENGIEITSFADIKSGTGLGSSGAFTVALIKAIILHQNRVTLSNSQIAQLASHIEINILNESVGLQDTYASALGSIRYFTINKQGKIRNKDLISENKSIKKLFSEYYLINTNQSRNATEEIKKTIFDKDKKEEMTKNLLQSKTRGIYTNSLLRNRSKMIQLGEHLTSQWKIKLERSPSSFHKGIDDIINKLIIKGCTGAKLIGAGGGGFILVHCPDESKAKIKKYLNELEMELQPFDIDETGIISFEL